MYTMGVENVEFDNWIISTNSTFLSALWEKLNAGAELHDRRECSSTLSSISQSALKDVELADYHMAYMNGHFEISLQ